MSDYAVSRGLFILLMGYLNLQMLPGYLNLQMRWVPTGILEFVEYLMLKMTIQKAEFLKTH